jgi:CheY-like chemotaxis protein
LFLRPSKKTTDQRILKKTSDVHLNFHTEVKVSMSAKKILIVDDNPVIRDFLTALCKGYEMDAESVTNGQEAVDIIKKQRFKAILMDLDMPIMGGLEATRIIRDNEKNNNHKRTPIIAISGTPDPDAAAVCSRLGFDFFIAKPIRVSEVIQTILTLAK